MRHALDTGMKFDASAPDDWCFHVHYDDLTADPVGVVRRIHEHFGEELRKLGVDHPPLADHLRRSSSGSFDRARLSRVWHG